jgi:hypothetical protein
MTEHATEHVGPQDPSKRNSPVVAAAAPVGGPAAPSSSVCYWNGNAYAIGATVCADHVLLRYTDSGGWVNVGSWDTLDPLPGPSEEGEMTTEMNSISNISGLPELPEQLAIAQSAINLPEVQDIMRRLSAYNLGIYMPHMHDEKTGAFRPLPAGMAQVEDNLRISFKSVDQLGRSNFVPVAWAWNDGPTPGGGCKSICMTIHHCEIAEP